MSLLESSLFQSLSPSFPGHLGTTLHLSTLSRALPSWPLPSSKCAALAQEGGSSSHCGSRNHLSGHTVLSEVSAAPGLTHSSV